MTRSLLLNTDPRYIILLRLCMSRLPVRYWRFCILPLPMSLSLSALCSTLRSIQGCSICNNMPVPSMTDNTMCSMCPRGLLLLLHLCRASLPALPAFAPLSVCSHHQTLAAIRQIALLPLILKTLCPRPRLLLSHLPRPSRFRLNQGSISSGCLHPGVSVHNSINYHMSTSLQNTPPATTRILFLPTQYHLTGLASALVHIRLLRLSYNNALSTCYINSVCLNCCSLLNISRTGMLFVSGTGSLPWYSLLC
jgi:hypothetical protein